VEIFAFFLLSFIDANQRQRVLALMSDNKSNKWCT